MISICVLGLDHFPWTFHPAVGNFRYVLIFSLFYFLFFLLGGCLEFFFDYVLGAIRVGFLCFFLVVGEKKIPWTNCIYLFAFSLNFVLFTGRRGVLGCFILSWWYLNHGGELVIRVRTAWLDSLFSRLFWFWSKQHVFFFFFSLDHNYWSFIYPQAHPCWERKKKKIKKGERGWMVTIHPHQLMRNESHKKKACSTFYDTIRLVYTYNTIIDILHMHTHSHTTVSPYLSHRWNQPRQAVLASQHLSRGVLLTTHLGHEWDQIEALRPCILWRSHASDCLRQRQRMEPRTLYVK